MNERMEIPLGNERYYKSITRELDHLVEYLQSSESQELEENVNSVQSRIKDLNDSSVRSDLLDRWHAIERDFLGETIKAPEAINAITAFKEYISKLNK